jgi:hypothetical protein
LANRSGRPPAVRFRWPCRNNCNQPT